MDFGALCDALETEGEESAIKLIAMRQPMAVDVRSIMVAMKSDFG